MKLNAQEVLETAFAEGRYPWEPGDPNAPLWGVKVVCTCNLGIPYGPEGWTGTPTCWKCDGRGTVFKHAFLPNDLDVVQMVLAQPPERIRMVYARVREDVRARCWPFFVTKQEPQFSWDIPRTMAERAKGDGFWDWRTPLRKEYSQLGISLIERDQNIIACRMTKPASR